MHAPVIEEPQAKDAGIAHRVAVRLQNRLGGQLRDFRMTSQANGLILHGRVRTYYGKLIAQHVVMEMSGLTIAANHIEVVC